MKTSGFTHRRFSLVVFMFLLFAAGLAVSTPPGVRPLLEGKWPGSPRGGPAYYVNVVGNRAYVALGSGGLAVFDVSDPTNIMQVGACKTRDMAGGVAVSGN